MPKRGDQRRRDQLHKSKSWEDQRAMEKAESQFRHARKRAKQRYGLKLTRLMHKQLVRIIQANQKGRVKQASLQTSRTMLCRVRVDQGPLWLVWTPQGKLKQQVMGPHSEEPIWIPLVFDVKRRAIVTFLPDREGILG